MKKRAMGSVWRANETAGKIILFRGVRMSPEKRLFPPASAHFATKVGILMAFDNGDLNENLSRKSKLHQNRTNISGTLRYDVIAFYCCWRHNRSLIHYRTVYDSGRGVNTMGTRSSVCLVNFRMI